MQNIGNCDTVWHFGHGKMISNETLMVSYDITMEKVASNFPEANHLSNSCRGSYEWADGSTTQGYEEYQKTFKEEEKMQRIFSPINSELGVGNLGFTSKMGLWSYSGLFEAFKP